MLISIVEITRIELYRTSSTIQIFAVLSTIKCLAVLLVTPTTSIHNFTYMHTQHVPSAG